MNEHEDQTAAAKPTIHARQAVDRAPLRETIPQVSEQVGRRSQKPCCVADDLGAARAAAEKQTGSLDVPVQFVDDGTIIF